MATFHPDGFVTSRCCTPRTLLCVRLAMLLWATCVFIASGIVTQDAMRFFAFFTQLSYLGMLVYLGIACYLTLAYHQRDVNPLHGAPTWAQLAFWLLYESMATFHLVVPLVFWALLSGDLLKSSSPLRWWASVSQHALDVVFVYAEVWMNTATMSSSWAHLCVLLLVLVCYVFWTWIYHASSGLWIYPFLDYDKPIHAAYYAGVFLLFMLAFALANYIHRWRAQLWPPMTGSKGTRGRSDSSVSLQPAMVEVVEGV